MAKTATPNEETNNSKLIATFRKRARILKHQGNAILGLILVSLASAIWIFFSAAEITKQDVAVDKVLSRSSEINDLIEDLMAKIPARPEDFVEPAFEPKTEDVKIYDRMITDLRRKSSDFVSILAKVDQEILKRISRGDIRIDRGVYDLSKIIRFSPDIESYWPHIKLNSSVEIFLIPLNQESPFAYRTNSVIGFDFKIREIPSTIESLQNIADEIYRMVETADEFRSDARKEHTGNISKLREEYALNMSNWTTATQKQREELGELRSGLKLVKDQEFKRRFGVGAPPQQQAEISVPFLIQTNITRFGPMIIILFFVSILINLYRYNMRLSAYYDARADALSIIEIDLKPDTYGKYISSLSPDMLDIGKPPRLPTEHAVEFAKTALSKVASSTK